MKFMNAVVTLVVFIFSFMAALYMSLHVLKLFFLMEGYPPVIQIGCGVLACTVGLRVAVWSANTYVTLADIFTGKGGASK